MSQYSQYSFQASAKMFLKDIIRPVLVTGNFKEGFDLPNINEYIENAPIEELEHAIKRGMEAKKRVIYKKVQLNRKK